MKIFELAEKILIKLGVRNIDLKLFFKIFISLFLLSFILLMTATKYYKSEFKIVSYSSSKVGMGSLGSLLSSVGGRNVIDDGESIVNVPEVMISLVRSEEFKTRLHNELILEGEYAGLTIKEAYSEFYNINSKNSIIDLSGYKVNKKLKNHITISKDRQTDIVTVQVEVFEDFLAKSMAEIVMKNLINEIIFFSSQTANEKIGFINSRLTEVSSELNVLENKLKDFKSQNKLINTPLLQLEFDRIQREVAMKNIVYQSLNQELELLKMDLVETSSDIYAIENPTFPYQKSRPTRSTGLIIALINCFIITYSFIYIRRIFKDNI